MSLISFIPEKYEEGFRLLAEIDNSVFADIENGLNLTNSVSSLDKLASNVAKIKGIDADDVEEIFISVGSIIPFLEREDMIKEVVNNLTQLAISSDLVDNDKSEMFAERLNLLLTNKIIYYASKANDLYTQYGNVFIQCRVVSDIRPVFDISLSDGAKAGIILHNLSIHYQSADEPYHKDINLTLDSEDVKVLIAALIRAEEKEKKLQLIFDKSGIKNLNS